MMCLLPILVALAVLLLVLLLCLRRIVLDLWLLVTLLLPAVRSHLRVSQCSTIAVLVFVLEAVAWVVVVKLLLRLRPSGGTTGVGQFKQGIFVRLPSLMMTLLVIGILSLVGSWVTVYTGILLLI